MLVELKIENFAIIDRLELQFDSGLVIFTGETGAGKSIIIDAVETLLGVRADATFIRTGVERSSVEGVFKIAPKLREAVHAILAEEDLLDDSDYVTLAREFRREGRNTARVNGRATSLALLKSLGELLIDLHGQSEHLSLLRVGNHLGLLDRFAEINPLLDDYQDTFRKLSAVRKELNDLRQAEADAEKRQELLTFQVNEIADAALQPGEEETLKEERTRLANAEKLAVHANTAISALEGADAESLSATDLIGQALQALESLAKVDETRTELSERMQGFYDDITELARDLGDYLQEIEFNPARLEEVEERIDLISDLKRKYAHTIPDINAYGEKAQAELDAITHAEEHMQELEMQEGQLLNEITNKAIAVSDQRHQSAVVLSRAIENELQHLRMEAALFGVDFSAKPDENGITLPHGKKVAFDINGFEMVEFMIAPNPGEGLKPLVKIASGGETARLMLALKNVLAQADHTPTLIFDEIDQGIGGRVGAIVGQKLWNLARDHQVLCITHLPQLAGYGELHYRVQKDIREGRTITVVDGLTGEDRLMELAQMLGEVSEGTLRSAHEILQSVQQTTA